MTSQILINELPATGFIRQSQLVGNRKKKTKGRYPFSAATLWRKVKAGKFPKPVKLSERVTAWRCEEVREWEDDPAGWAEKNKRA